VPAKLQSRSRIPPFLGLRLVCTVGVAFLSYFVEDIRRSEWTG